MTTIKHRRDLWRILLEGNAAEIGVAEGFFSADMLSWPINFPKVYMVDRWQCVPHQKGDGGHAKEWHDKNFNDAMQRVSKYGERAEPLRGDSVEMAKCVPDASLSLVYIDADHSFEGVTRDIKAWFSKLKQGGCMAFHDYENISYGVKEAVKKFVYATPFRIELLPEDKQEDAGAYFIV